jgi:hypothetical protein
MGGFRSGSEKVRRGESHREEGAGAGKRDASRSSSDSMHFEKRRSERRQRVSCCVPSARAAPGSRT